MKNAFDVLEERGFLEQVTHEEEIRNLLAKESVTFYIGFDPTADSLTIGHFLTLMAMSHMQKAGHRPIALVGGGTGMVGDPTFKTDMRRVMPTDEIEKNVSKIKRQFSRFIDFSDGKALLINNADWLLDLKYVPFIREYGAHFTISRMINAECYKSRLDKGLTFFEFNYMLMQSYDFLELFRRFGCKMQLGGSDQWANILGGAELIRRVEGASAYGVTLKLLQTSSGEKMGKTAKGAVWLDAEKTSPYELFQYLRNVDDADVGKCLSLLTFLPMDEINRLKALKDEKINEAKEILAFETTKIIHDEAQALKALDASRALFSDGADDGAAPTTEISRVEVSDGIDVITLLEKARLIPTRSEGRRLVTQGGVKINGEKVSDVTAKIFTGDFKDGSLIIKKGKKGFHKIKLV
ncbi:MAG: tyrosine--tRNA ligase [Clostridiales bacterium]|jgi:tyrosyl-tRNA synthetase|nr:tyrosine--tRNA ligase [Clostridiales bacterium]